MYKILLTKKAGRDLSELPKNIRVQITNTLDELATFGAKASNIKKLQTPFPGYRKRVGDYRILFEVNEELIVIYRISKRSETYR